MRGKRRTGRIVGVLLLLHLAAGLTAPFIVLLPLWSPPGFLVGAAGMPDRVRGAVMLLFAGSALPIGIACAVLPVLRRRSPATSYGLLALAAASFSLQAVDNAHLLSLLSLSQEYARAGAENTRGFEVLAAAFGAARRWSHYSFLLAVGCWILLLFVLLYRFRLVPRPLAALGAVASLLQIAGVTLRGLWGLPPEPRLAMPLAPAYVALALWLMVRGIDDRDADEVAGRSGSVTDGA